ncbi:MAG: prepilin-type N-terminal cleavage/methylation domain-containing protein [Conexivisphaerales archaeon]
MKRRGFTLFELIAVITVVTVLISISVFSYEKASYAQAIKYLQSLGPMLYEKILVIHYSNVNPTNAFINSKYGYLNKYIANKNNAFSVSIDSNFIRIFANTDNYGQILIYTGPCPTFLTDSQFWSNLGLQSSQEPYEGPPPYWHP